MRIGFGSDHAAVDMKAILMEHLAEQGHECVDFGPESAEQRTDYPDKALEVAEAVKTGEIDKGVLCCGTGIGMALAANKVPGIRASVCGDPFSAEMTVRHNNANIIAFPAIARCQDTQDHNDTGPEQHREHVIHVPPAQSAENRPDDRGACVEMLGENIRCAACHYIAQETAADTGGHTDKDGQEHICSPSVYECCFDADNGKDPQTDRVCNAQDRLIDLRFMYFDRVFCEPEHDNPGRNRRKCKHRITKRCRRCDVQDDITDDSSADCCCHGKNRHAEEVHFLLYADKGS